MSDFGNYSTNSGLLDRTGYGVKKGLVFGGMAGGAVLGTGALLAGRTKGAIFAMPTMTTALVAGTIGASIFSSFVASHVNNGSDTSRLITATAGMAVPAAIGGAMLALRGTPKNPAAAAAFAAAGAAIGGAAGFLSAPFVINRS